MGETNECKVAHHSFEVVWVEGIGQQFVCACAFAPIRAVAHCIRS